VAGARRLTLLIPIVVAARLHAMDDSTADAKPSHAATPAQEYVPPADLTPPSLAEIR
jgi:hypothetical protein